jgi:hypothetical protein
MKKTLFFVLTVLFVFSSVLFAGASGGSGFNVSYIDFGVGGIGGLGISKQYGAGDSVTERNFSNGGFTGFFSGHFPIAKTLAFLLSFQYQKFGTEYPETSSYYKNVSDSGLFAGSIGIRIYLE